MPKNILFLLQFIVSAFIAYSVVIFVIYIIDQIKTRKPTKPIKQPKQQPIVIPLSLYNNLCGVMEKLIQIKATVQEINNLIERNAEVPYNILKDSKIGSEYLSFDVLNIWKKSYMDQMNMYVDLFDNIYQNVRVSLPFDTRVIFDEKLNDVKSFCRDNTI